MSALSSTPPVHDRTKREHVARVARIKFHKEEDGYTIAELADGHTAKGKADLDALTIGDTFRFLGRWDEHDVHGAFFRFETFIKHEPATRGAVIRYLSKHCDDIGEKRAAKLYDRYGGDTCKRIRLDTAQVIADGLLTEEVARAAADTLQKMAVFEETKLELFGLFDGRGFPGALIESCIEKWGAKAPEIVRKNPLTLLVRGLPGCGFKRCDRLYLDLKLPKNSLKRQMICGWARLRDETSSQGHTWHDAETFIAEIREHVSGAIDPISALRVGIYGGWIARRRDDRNKLWVAVAEKAKSERDVARHVHRLLAGDDVEILWPAAPLPGISEAKTPSDHQNAVWESIRTSPLAILTGGPGTGKTFTVGAMLRSIAAQHGIRSVAVCAPTGKAAVRCTQSLRSQGLPLRAVTIHSLLRIKKSGYGGERWAFEFNEDNPLPYRFVVADESSMIDADLMADLLAACGTPRPIPGRPARQLTAPVIDPPRCLRCHRELTDPTSWSIGYGPTCARLVPKSSHREVAPVELVAGETLPAVPPIPVAGTHVLLVGDPNQLPPVGHGAPLRDLIAAGVPTGELTEIRRNAGTIVRACAAVKAKKPVPTDDRLDLAADDAKNLRIIETKDAAETVAMLENVLASMAQHFDGPTPAKWSHFHPVWQTQVLVATNTKSEVSRRQLNERLQKLLNPAGKEVSGNPFRIDDKIICLKNSWMTVVERVGAWANEDSDTDAANYQPAVSEDGEIVERYVANGEIGRVVATAPKMAVARMSEGEELIKILFGKKKESEDGESEDGGVAGHFDLAYAITCHKAQGSESPCVIVVIDDQGGRVTSREWHYTAISRAAQACLLIGSRATLEKQAKRSGLRRLTFLAETLRGLFDGGLGPR